MVYHLITVHPYSSVIIYYNSPLIHTFARDGRKLSNVNKFTACVEIRYTRRGWHTSKLDTRILPAAKRQAVGFCATRSNLRILVFEKGSRK
jgi:hypothetical protein